MTLLCQVDQILTNQSKCSINFLLTLKLFLIIPTHSLDLYSPQNPTFSWLTDMHWGKCYCIHQQVYLHKYWFNYKSRKYCKKSDLQLVNVTLLTTFAETCGKNTCLIPKVCLKTFCSEQLSQVFSSKFYVSFWV